MNFQATVRQSGGITLIALQGRISLTEGDVLRQTLHDLVKKGQKKIVLDLQKVSYLDSSGIGQLVNGYKAIKKHGGQIKTIRLTPRVKEIIRVTNLSAVFEDYTDERAAIRSFA